jgi:hypothetical protein
MHVGMNAEPTHSFSQHYMQVSGYGHALLAGKEPLVNPRQQDDTNME